MITLYRPRDLFTLLVNHEGYIIFVLYILSIH